jgi:hypothetical protein
MNQNENKMYEQKYLKYKAKYLSLKKDILSQGENIKPKYLSLKKDILSQGENIKAKYLALKKQSQTGSGTSPSTLMQLGISSLPPINPNFYNVINNLPSEPNPDFVRIVDGQSITTQLGSGMSPSTLIQLAASSVPPVPPSFYNTISEVASPDVPVPANSFGFSHRGGKNKSK